jgi:hypothetical protein
MKDSLPTLKYSGARRLSPKVPFCKRKYDVVR